MNNIKKFRGKLGMTQKDLAEELKVTRSLVISLEKESCHSTSKKTTEKMCELFNVTPCVLYGVDNFRYMPQNKEDVLYLMSILNEELKKWE